MVILVHDYFLTLVFLLLTVFQDNVHSFMYTYDGKVLQLFNLYTIATTHLMAFYAG